MTEIRCKTDVGEGQTSEAIGDAIVAGLAVLLLELFPLEFCGFGLDFVVEELDEFGLGVWGRILDIVKPKHAEQLRYGKRSRIEVGVEIVANSDDLGGGHSRHDEVCERAGRGCRSKKARK